MQHQENMIESLSRTIENQKTELQALTEKDRLNSEEIGHLKVYVSNIVKQTEHLDKVCRTAILKMNNSQESLNMDRRDLSNMYQPVKRPSPSSHIAFYAHLSNTHFNPGIHHVIVYNKVQLNMGNAYDENSGTFTVPSSGLYVFTWTVIASGHGHVFTDLVVNGKVYGGVIGDSDDSLALNVGSTTVVLDAQAGDKVYVWTTDHQQPTSNIISTEGARSSFSGWRIN